VRGYLNSGSPIAVVSHSVTADLVKQIFGISLLIRHSLNSEPALMKRDAVLMTAVIAKVNFDSGLWLRHGLTFSTSKQNGIRNEDAGASKAPPVRALILCDPKNNSDNHE
jgi:hypothetical protein